jgi:transposase
MVKSRCKWCGKEVERAGSKPATFCSLACKGAWQRTQKPVDRDWLYQRYVVDGLSTYQIAAEVGRDPKGIYQWLRGYGIPTRARGWATVPSGEHPYQQESWLREQYVERRRSASDIAAEFGITPGAVLFQLRRVGIQPRTTSEARAVKHWGAVGAANPMFGKRGAEVPNWKGGVTPERQALYSSPEWARAALAVWKRDRATCRRCGITTQAGATMNIHHIVSFAVRALRAEVSNLALLCEHCHHFVHSRRNVAGEFGKREGGDAI